MQDDDEGHENEGYVCFKCGGDVEDELVDEMRDDPEMVVLCTLCARKGLVALGLVTEDEE